MNNFINTEYIRLVLISAISPILAFYTPMLNFIVALFVMFWFNIWCGMKADGVTVKRWGCEKFEMKKFTTALRDLCFYVTINGVIYTVMCKSGDNKEAIFAIKTLTYIYMYVYLQNSFKNLIKYKPTNFTYRIIYHVIRLEFKRALPAHIHEVIERLEKESSPDKIEEGKENV